MWFIKFIFLISSFFGAHGAIGCGQKSFTLVRRCQQLLSGLLAKRYAPSVTSITSVANDRVTMKWSRRLCTDLLAFSLQLRKTSARRPSMKAVLQVIPSNGVPYLHMRSVGSHITSGVGKEGKMDNKLIQFIVIFYSPNVITYFWWMKNSSQCW